MAVQRKKNPKKKNLPGGPINSSNSPRPLKAIQVLVARKLGQGYSVPEIARAYADQICPNSDKKSRLRQARNRIRAWARREDFRDLVWAAGLNNVDIQSGSILAGVTKKARAGRVDAARLALEVTGRHSPNAEITPAVVQVVFTDMPRPRREHLQQGADYDADVDAEVEEVEED